MIDYCKAVVWEESGVFHVGRVAIARFGPTMTGHVKRGNRCVDGNGEVLHDDSTILVRHHHTGELEYVRQSKLENYPTSPIPEPTTHEQAEPGRSEA